MEQEQDEQTHDFVRISADVLVTEDVQEFDGLIKAMTSNLLAIAWFFIPARRLVYRAISTFRHDRNKVARR